MKKICSTCKKSKNISDFSKDKNRADGLSNRCKACKKHYRDKNIDEINRKNRLYKKKNRAFIKDKYFKQLYGISFEDVLTLFKKQKEKCSICGKKLNSKRDRGFVLDHSHKTGKPRGILCNYCNLFLGLALESPLILTSAIKYLNSWNK